MWWIWIPYIISLVVVVFVSNKLAVFIDALDKKTKLSGAFLGGVLLAAVTSLPELITSITAAILGEPEMTLGNILGSNVFDIAIVGFLMVIFAKRVKTKDVSKSNVITCAFTLLVAVLILICSIFNIQIVIPYLNINILTPIILVLYFLAIFFTREKPAEPQDAVIVNIEKKDNSIIIKDDEAVSQSANKVEAMSVKQIVLWFILCAVVLVGVSVAMTFMVDIIATEYNLGRGLAGALFLGIATSLPEIVSTFALVRLGNFDAGYGNIVGSCLFNFTVIALADICFTAGTVFLTDMQSIILSACLVAAAFVLLSFSFIRRSRSNYKYSLPIQVGAGVLICAAYVVFLLLSV
ncbi:MAG: hypothetical protein J6C13_04065 [Clostridia bacterium]|nr:hypothetical protein [Clostridia bacterium]